MHDRRSTGSPLSPPAAVEVMRSGPTASGQCARRTGQALTVAKLKQATVDEIREVPGFGPALAESVHAALHGDRT